MPSSASPAPVPSGGTAAKRNRPSTITVFASAFVAGAAAAFGINRALDSQLAQSRPQVECDPIFVALHALPQGSAVTVWDVALRDWPRAMLPSTALGPRDSFEGMVLRHPLREGQPLLSVQLVPSESAGSPAATSNESFLPPTPAAAARTTQVSQPDRDLWASDSPEPTVPQAAPVAVPPLAQAAPRTAPVESPAEPIAVTQAKQPEPAVEAPPATTPVVPEPPTAAIPASTPTPVATASPIQDESPLAETAVVAERTPMPADQPATEAVTESAAAPATERDATAQVSNVPTQPEQSVVPLPLVAPVPTSPSTDIERPLAAITVPRTPRAEAAAVTEPAQASTPAEPVVQDTIATNGPATEPALRPEPAVSEPTAAEPVAGDAATAGIPGNDPPATDSVLVAPPSGPEPAVTPAPDKSREPAVRYLVVPERIAMQADSSFVSPPPAPAQDLDPTQGAVAGQPIDGTAGQASKQANYAHGAAEGGRAPAVQPLPATAAEARAKEARAKEARAKQATRPETRTQKPTNQNRSRTSKTLGGWLPSFMGGGDSRGPATTARSGQTPSAR